MVEGKPRLKHRGAEVIAADGGVRHRTVSHERALAVGGCPAAPAQHL